MNPGPRPDQRRKHDLEALFHEIAEMDPEDPAVTAAAIIKRVRAELDAFLVRSLTADQRKAYDLAAAGKLYMNYPLTRAGELVPNGRSSSGGGSTWFYGYYDADAWPGPSWQRISNQTIAGLTNRKLIVEPQPTDPHDPGASDRGHRRVQVRLA